MTDFLSKHAVRIYAVLGAVASLAKLYWPGLPDEAWLAVAAAVLGLGLGEAVQRHEDTKTLKALYAPSPWEDELRGRRAE
ncbi:hypothetical protein [Streptomyces sp. NPDC059874]|uniref:hypothetical protein n=1 Tax=Streptomyces sp. NPDC059874 TaxID=3346983 RepID=UPI0036539258